MTQFGFPYRIGPDGGTEGADLDAHIEQLIALVLFTAPGERVNRPDFGSGVRQLLFTENAPELATALQHLVQGSLQRFLADLIEVRGVAVAAEESTLSVLVQYQAIGSSETRTVKLVREA